MRRIQDVNAQSVQEKHGHAGLWHDKYLPAFDPQSKQTHLQEVTRICTYNDCYTDYFERWKYMLRYIQPQPVELVTQSRMIVGIGEASVRDIGIMLHHTYGVPFIPGSSLKGLAAAYARKLPGWDVKSESYRTLFGDGRQSGSVDFLDAIWIPDEQVQPLSVDIVNVHYQSYYTHFSKGNSDQELQRMFMEAPVPNYFVCVQPKVKLLVAVNGPQVWAEAALELLMLATDEIGIGAKTNAGYGRLRPAGLEYIDSSVVQNNEKPDEQRARDYIEKNLKLKPNQVKTEMNNKVKYLLDECDESLRVKQLIARHMLDMAKAVKVDPEKAWYKNLEALVNQSTE
jgi:CRISPR-associated protein Cmr6